jgi:hypothetical protein
MGDSLSFFGIKKRINTNNFEKEEYIFWEEPPYADFHIAVFVNNTGTAGN